MRAMECARFPRTPMVPSADGDDALSGPASGGEETMPATVPEPAVQRAPLRVPAAPGSERRRGVPAMATLTAGRSL